MTVEFIRNSVGIVDKYDKGRGYGWIKLACDKWKDAFVSYRDIEPEVDGLKRLDIGQKVKLELCSNHKGYIAKNVIVINDDEYNKVVEEIKDLKFNK